MKLHVGKSGEHACKIGRTRARASMPPALILNRVLVPVDFSACSENALSYAAAFVRKFKAQLVLLHVIELYPIDYLFGITTGTAERTQLMAQAEAALANLSRRWTTALGRRQETMIRFGKPYQEIIKATRERRAQLVIMGTHGYSGFLHFQLGSTAERVIRCAPCPVVVVREQHPALVNGGGAALPPACPSKQPGDV